MFYYKQICSFHLWHRCGNKRCILWSWATEQKSSWYYQINAPVPPSQMLVWRPACAEYDWSARYHQNKTHWQNKFYNSSNSAWASLLLWWITIYSMYWIYRANRASFMNKKLISSNWHFRKNMGKYFVYFLYIVYLFIVYNHRWAVWY